MQHKITKYIAVVLLGIMFFILYTSTLNDSTTMDEQAHIPSGYSYLTERDYRLNPEHPPLMKDLSAIPLLFLDLNFPTDTKAWKDDYNGQWDMGKVFLYQSGNDADKIIFYSRIPMMLLAILFGWMFFRWVQGLYGDKVALLALFLFSFSPTFIAHSRYVTTDLAATFGFFIGLSSFINFLMRQNTPQSKKSLITAGVALGVAFLLKFSLMLLVPLYFILGMFYVLLKNYEEFKWGRFLKEEFKMVGKIVLLGLISIAIIWPVYSFHVMNYPIERQVADTTHYLKTFRVVRPLADIAIWLSGIPVVRAFGHFYTGILMVLQRAAGGNTTYFMGEITNTGWPQYFPLLYLFKEHLALHILTLLGVWFGLKNIKNSTEKSLKNVFGWMRENYALTASFIFIFIYWVQAVMSPLNIGVRHVMPTFPFIYLLVSRQTIRWIKSYSIEIPKNFLGFIVNIYRVFLKPAKRALFVMVLMLWMFFSTVLTFPNYLSYYNVLAGGTENGHKIATDSNYDWGQDLKRLRDWVDEYNINCEKISKLEGSCTHLSQNKPIDKLALDYFGGGSPEYYFGDVYESWWSSRGVPEGWFAVSLTFLSGAQATPIDGVNGFLAKNVKPEDQYPYLVGKEPVARAGKSILIYKF